MKKLLILVAFLALPIAAMANGNGHSYSGSGHLGGYVGSVDSNASSVSGGGSMAGATVNGTGFAINGTTNGTSGFASAGGHIAQSGVTTTTDIGSTSFNVSGGLTFGQHTSGSTSGQVGTDVNAGSWGQFHAGQFGANGGVSFSGN